MGGGKAKVTLQALQDCLKITFSKYCSNTYDLFVSTWHVALSSDQKVQVIKLATPSTEEEIEHNLEDPGAESQIYSEGNVSWGRSNSVATMFFFVLSNDVFTILGMLSRIYYPHTTTLPFWGQQSQKELLIYLKLEKVCCHFHPTPPQIILFSIKNHLLRRGGGNDKFEMYSVATFKKQYYLRYTCTCLNLSRIKASNLKGVVHVNNWTNFYLPSSFSCISTPEYT